MYIITIKYVAIYLCGKFQSVFLLTFYSSHPHHIVTAKYRVQLLLLYIFTLFHIPTPKFCKGEIIIAQVRRVYNNICPSDD